jgi:MFS family permease
MRLPVPAAQRRVLARRGIQPVAAAAAAAFVGVSGEPLAMVLVAREATGSFATAGLVVAAYALTAGLLAPLRGRALDRRGGRVIVPIAGWHLGAVLTLIVAAELRAPAGVLVGLAGLAGFARSPLFGALRTLWGRLVPSDELEAAYGMQANLQQLSYIAGPLLAGALIAAMSAELALVALAILTFAASAAFAATSAARAWQPAAAAAPSGGVIRRRGLQVVALTAGMTNATLGMLGIAFPAVASTEGAAPFAGVLFALVTAGSLAGGFAYAARRWTGGTTMRYALLLGALGGGLALLAVPPSLALLAPFAFLAGAPLAALMACRFRLIDDVAPRGAATEAAMWISAAEAAGASLGQAAAGVVVDQAGTDATFLAAAGVAVLAGGIVLIARDVIQGSVVKV